MYSAFEVLDKEGPQQWEILAWEKLEDELEKFDTETKDDLTLHVMQKHGQREQHWTQIKEIRTAWILQV